jgi:polyphosphate kinase 2 (PPK2 family)
MSRSTGRAGQHWKVSLAGIHERAYWDQYMEAYEECLRATSTHHAPWSTVNRHRELGSRDES